MDCPECKVQNIFVASRGFMTAPGDGALLQELKINSNKIEFICVSYKTGLTNLPTLHADGKDIK